MIEEKIYSLPKEFGVKWVEALRSGNYPQGKGNLLNDTGYCCLGVASSLVGKQDKDLFQKCYPQLDWLPEETLKRPGEKQHLEALLSIMNDSGKTFAEIADWIEANVQFI